MDAILLLDTSASMLETDPGDRRLAALRLFLSLLDDGDRFALIGFDAEAKVLSDFRNVTEENVVGWLAANHREMAPQGSYTNLLAPVAAALELAGRRRTGVPALIILLTDGRMDTGSAESDRRFSEELRTRTLQALIAEGVHLYGLAFSDRSDLAFLQDLAQPSGGFVRMAGTPEELPRVFAEIFEAIKRPMRLPVIDGHFRVDGEVSELKLVSPPQAGAELILMSPAGDRVNVDAAEASAGVIHLQRPQAGDWRIDGGSGKTWVFVDSDLALDVQVPEVILAGNVSSAVGAWLTRDGLRLQPDAIASTVSMSAFLHGLDRSSEMGAPGPQQLAVGRRTDGGFVVSLPVLETGLHELQLTVGDGTFRRSRNVVLHAREVSAATATSPAVPAEATPSRSSVANHVPVAPRDAVVTEVAFQEALNRFLLVNITIVAVSAAGYAFWRCFRNRSR